jgi:YhcG PDDEXK nuclease domain/DUF1016 N-terminal domain
MQLLLNDIRQLITEARQQVKRNVNATTVMTYWHIGKRIVEDEQQGKKRAQYAAAMFKHLSENLIQDFGRGFSETNLKQMRQFYLTYSIRQLQTDELNAFPNPRISWTHYVFLMRLKDLNERAFYEIETAENMWRQKRITFDEKHFHIDLVFYNRFLRAFVLIDLKIGELEHKDLGQMQMYVHYFDREMRLPDENPTVGIVLCRSKSDMLVEYTLPQDNTQIFASQYALVLPSKEDFIKVLKQNNGR